MLVMGLNEARESYVFGHKQTWYFYRPILRLGCFMFKFKDVYIYVLDFFHKPTFLYLQDSNDQIAKHSQKSLIITNKMVAT